MPAFKGQVFRLPRIARCPVCGKEPVLRKDSTKRFQVWCDCGCKSGWTTKAQAIIDWYNIIIAVQSQTRQMPDLSQNPNTETLNVPF